MIVIWIIFILLVVYAIGGILHLVHCVILKNNANYEYWATKGKIEKVTYADSSVVFFYKKNTVFGLPFFWKTVKKAYNYDRVKEEMFRQLSAISDKRVIKKQTLK